MAMSPIGMSAVGVVMVMVVASGVSISTASCDSGVEDTRDGAYWHGKDSDGAHDHGWCSGLNRAAATFLEDIPWVWERC